MHLVANISGTRREVEMWGYMNVEMQLGHFPESIAGGLMVIAMCVLFDGHCHVCVV